MRTLVSYSNSKPRTSRFADRAATQQPRWSSGLASRIALGNPLHQPSRGSFLRESSNADADVITTVEDTPSDDACRTTLQTPAFDAPNAMLRGAMATVAATLIVATAVLPAMAAVSLYEGQVTEAPNAMLRGAMATVAATLIVATAVLPAMAAVSLYEGQVIEAPIARRADGKEYVNDKEIFKASQYAGRWYEVASLKKGFAGEGQRDCHCTQGIYTPVSLPAYPIALSVATFCVHGAPDGRLSGIEGFVSCADPVTLAILPEFETSLEREQKILEKCTLKFPSIPIIPTEPYNIIRTDYTSYALVQGAKDRSFVQVYSRTPRPGAEFLKTRLQELGELGYPVDEIQETPQDCEEMSASQMMSRMQKALDKPAAVVVAETQSPAKAMRGIDLGPAPVSGIKFDMLRNPVETFKDLFKLAR